MKIRALLVGIILVLSATAALAAGPYVGGAVGLSYLHDSDIEGGGTASYDLGYGLTLSAGYKFDAVPVRAEFEFGYKKASVKDAEGYDVDGVDVSAMSFMVNGYYDIKTNSGFTPYVGAGIGAIRGELSGAGSLDGNDTQFGYQLILGCAYDFNKNLALDFSYRFQGSTDFDIGYGGQISYRSSNFMLGMRYTF
jgi:opacity protein-like surface antigen